MNVRNVFFVLVVIFSISSCAFHGGTYSSSANISSSNFKIVKTVSGQSKTLKVLGIGGLGKDALVAEAKATLLFKYPLAENQILGNVVVDSKTSFLLVVSIQRVTVTADIIEFSN